MCNRRRHPVLTNPPAPFALPTGSPAPTTARSWCWCATFWDRKAGYGLAVGRLLFIAVRVLYQRLWPFWTGYRLPGRPVSTTTGNAFTCARTSTRNVRRENATNDRTPTTPGTCFYSTTRFRTASRVGVNMFGSYSRPRLSTRPFVRADAATNGPCLNTNNRAIGVNTKAR